MKVNEKKLRVLELFCGTKSFSKACLERGWEVTTLDNAKKFDPDILIDIMDWDYKSHPPVDVFWAGTPCTTFSIASFKRDPKKGNLLAEKTLEILEHFKKLNPNLIWAIENPWSSLLRKQDFMQGIDYKVCDYCQYGFPYRKRTIIFGNIEWNPKKCPGKGKCPEMVGQYHKECAQHGKQTKPPWPIQKKQYTQTDLYRMPPNLCRELVEAIATQVNGTPALQALQVSGDSQVNLDGLD